MKKLINYIDECKTILGIEKDAELARYLEISTASMTGIRKGGGVNDRNLMIIARISKQPIEHILLANIATREKNPIFKKAWENISQKTGIAAGFLFVFQEAMNFSAVFNSVECILC